MAKKRIPELQILPVDGLVEFLNATMDTEGSSVSSTPSSKASPSAPSPKRQNKKASQPKPIYGTKTSLYLEESLFLRAKHYCADSRMTLTELVNKSLSSYLRKQEKKSAKEEKKNDASAERQIPSEEE